LSQSLLGWVRKQRGDAVVHNCFVLALGSQCELKGNKARRGLKDLFWSAATHSWWWVVGRAL
jgi:hypothetical protein